MVFEHLPFVWIGGQRKRSSRWYRWTVHDTWSRTDKKKPLKGPKMDKERSISLRQPTGKKKQLIVQKTNGKRQTVNDHAPHLVGRSEKRGQGGQGSIHAGSMGTVNELCWSYGRRGILEKKTKPPVKRWARLCSTATLFLCLASKGGTKRKKTKEKKQGKGKKGAGRKVGKQ